MAAERVLKNTGEDELKHEVVRLKTRMNMLKYYANWQIRLHKAIPGMPQTRLDKDVIDIWKIVIAKIGEK